MFNPTFKLTTTFQNVSGMQVGNNVRFSGINVGTVDNIKIINDSTVQVDMIIQQSVQPFIKVDCEAAIGSEGIIGDRILMITQGTAEAASAKNGDMLLSVEPVEIDAIMQSISITAINAEIITDQLAEIMININQGEGTLGMLIQDTTIAKNINKTIINLKSTSKGLDQNMEAAKSNFLLRGFFRKKEREAERKAKEKENANKSKEKESEEKEKK